MTKQVPDDLYVRHSACRRCRRGEGRWRLNVGAYSTDIRIFIQRSHAGSGVLVVLAGCIAALAGMAFQPISPVFSLL
jgi:hypothetical protein